MKVKDLVRELLAYDNQDEEVKIVWLPHGSADAAYLSIVGSFAADNYDGEQFIGLDVSESAPEFFTTIDIG